MLTLEKQVVVCTLDGAKKRIDTQADVSSSTCLDYAYESFTGAMLIFVCVRLVAWSPSGKQIAIGRSIAQLLFMNEIRAKLLDLSASRSAVLMQASKFITLTGRRKNQF